MVSNINGQNRQTIVLYMTPEEARALQKLVLEHLDDWRFNCVDCGVGVNVAQLPQNLYEAIRVARKDAALW